MAKNYKLTIWYILVGLLALVMWGTGSQAQFSSVTGVSLQLPSFVAFLLLSSTIVIGYTLFRKNFWVWPLVVVFIVGGLFMVQFGFNWLNLTAVIIFFILNLEAYRRAGGEMKDRIKINIEAVLNRGLRPIVVGIFILVSFATYQSPLMEQIKTSGNLPSQTRKLIQQITEKMIGNKADAVPAKQRQSIISEVTSQTYQEINSLLKPYFQYAPPALAFGLFLILFGLSWLFVFIAMLVGLGLFWILKKTKVVQIEKKQIEAEVLVI